MITDGINDDNMRITNKVNKNYTINMLSCFSKFTFSKK